MVNFPTKNRATLILTTDSSSWTSKTHITEVSCKSNEFDKLTQKNALTIVRESFQIWTARNFPQMCPFLMQNWTRKTMEASPSPCGDPSTRYAPFPYKNRVQGHRKWVHLKFDNVFEFVRLENRYNRCFLQIERIR